MDVITKLRSPDWWRELCLKDLFFLCRNVLQTLEDPTPGFKDLYGVDEQKRPATHKLLCEFVSKWAFAGQKLLIMLPRGWVKSYLITVGWLIQRLLNNLLGRQREHWLIANATLPNAKEFLEKIKYNLAFNEALRGFFRDVLPAEPASQAERWTQGEIQIAGNKFEVGSAEGNLVSLHFSGGAINDDLVNFDNSRTTDQIGKIIDWWKLEQSLLMPKSIEIIPGTRYDDDDLYGYILREMLGVPREKISSPFLEWHKGNWHLFHMACWEDIENQKGSTFPVLFPDEKLHELIRMQGELAGGQYLLDPLSMSRGKIKAQWLRHWKVGDIPKIVNTIMTVDPSGEAKPGSDPTGLAIADWGVDKQVYVRVGARKLITDIKLLEWIIELACIYQPGMIGIEQNKYSTLVDLCDFVLPQMIKQGRVPAAYLSYAKTIPGLFVELKHRGRPKEVRLGNMAGYFEKGIFLLPPDGCDDLKDELLRMGLSKKDNIVDALAYQLDVGTFPQATDPMKYLEVPDELKLTDEEREKKTWEAIVEEYEKDPLMRGFEYTKELY